MIHENMAVIGGRALGVVNTRRGPELWVRSSYLKHDGSPGFTKLPILLAKEEGGKLAEEIKKGDFVVLQCVLAVFKDKAQGDKEGRIIGVVWNIYTEPTIVRGNGSVEDVTAGNAAEGINFFRLSGYFNLSYDDTQAKLKHPKLIDGKKSPYCRFEIGNQMRRGEKTTKFNLMVSGASAENYVSKYFEADDNVMVRGSLGMEKSYHKFERPDGNGVNQWVNIQTPTLWVDRFNGVSKVTPKKYEQNNG